MGLIISRDVLRATAQLSKAESSTGFSGGPGSRKLVSKRKEEIKTLKIIIILIKMKYEYK